MRPNYLPSKQFIIRVIVIIILIAGVFSVYKVINYFKNKPAKDNTAKPVTVIEKVQKDTNSNGIPDWEEYLWGLDPNKNGVENKEFILAKKDALTKSGDITPIDDSKAITDNELLSQEFFATIVALQQTGQLDETAIQSVSEAVGQNIIATPIPDIYTSNMLTIQNDSTVANTAYHEALGELIIKYSDADIGSELTFIVQGLGNKDPQALFVAETVASAYRSFGSELIKIPVPRALSAIHLSAANNYEKTGQTIKDLSQILSDPIIGMKAIINYKNYSDALAVDLEKISEILQ
jgi:hypothetical protein